MHGEGRKSEVEEALLRNSVQSMGTAPRRLADKVMAMVGDRKTAMLLCALFALVFSRTVDQTLYYRLNYSYAYFVWYLSTIILPVAFLIISWPVVLYKIFVSGDVTPQMLKFPLYQFAIMGLFDCLYNLFSTFPVHHLGGDLSNVLSQSVLPINMLFARIFLSTKYNPNHYLGAFLVIYGIAVKLGGSTDWDGSLGWILMMIFAQTPSAASNVYKQLGMQGVENLDIWYSNAWISTFQLGWGLLTFWTMYIGVFMDPYPALTNTHSFTQYISNANKCLFGRIVYIEGLSSCEDAIMVGTYTSSDECRVDCGDADTIAAVYLFMFFIIFNITYNQLMLYIFKYGSSVLFVVASAVRLPLVDALNSWKWIAGPAQDDYHKEDTYALIILVVAIVVYYWVPEEAQEKAEIGSAMNMTRASRTSRASVDLLTVMPGPRPSFSALAEHTEESTHTTPLETHSEVE